MNIDKIIIGAGLAGIVLAERLARINNEHVLLVEQRNHIGGNCYDFYDSNEILIHKYGPHIFHTDDDKIWNYLSQFTEWQYYQHRVKGIVDGQKVSIPFNLTTIYDLLPNTIASKIEDKLIATYGFDKRLSILELYQSEDRDLKFLADFVYEKVFLNYTIKQWGIEPDKISPTIFSRVPIVISKDDRYFQDRYQGLPKYGYTKMFNKMLDHPSIKILLNTSMSEVVDILWDKEEIRFMGSKFTGKLIYTGMLDELFEYRYGELPYRALKFNHEILDKAIYQDVAVVNYPFSYDFTRITEFKHMTGQLHHHTSILREYPCQYSKENTDIPCYPIISSNNQVVLEKYLKLIQQYSNIFLIGRLAEYRYYDMDDMVAKALKLFEEKFSIARKK